MSGTYSWKLDHCPSPPIKGKDLPFSISSHCMVLINPSTVYIIGGWQNGSESKKTWIFNPLKDFQMTEGPSLIVDRYHHCCGKMFLNGRLFIGNPSDKYPGFQKWQFFYFFNSWASTIFFLKWQLEVGMKTRWNFWTPLQDMAGF